MGLGFVKVWLDCLTDVGSVFESEKIGEEMRECIIVLLPTEAANEQSVVHLSLIAVNTYMIGKGVQCVVNYQCLFKVAAEHVEVFDEGVFHVDAGVTVESVFDEDTSRV